MVFLRRFKRLSFRTKITSILIFLVVLTGIICFFWAVYNGSLGPKAEGEEASLNIYSDSTNYENGVDFTVRIIATSNAPASEIAVRSLHYDGKYIDPIAVRDGSLGNLIVTENTIDKTAQTITYLAALSDISSGGFQGSETIAYIDFKAINPGDAYLNFDFTLFGQIGDCDIISQADGRDLLNSAQPNIIKILEPPKSPTPESPPPPPPSSSSPKTPIPTLTPTPEETQTPEYTSEPTETQTSAIITDNTPSPEESSIIMPSEEPTESPEPTKYINIAGFGISSTIAIILLIVVPLTITSLVFLTWWAFKKKKGLFNFDLDNKKDNSDDDTI